MSLPRSRAQEVRVSLQALPNQFPCTIDSKTCLTRPHDAYAHALAHDLPVIPLVSRMRFSDLPLLNVVLNGAGIRINRKLEAETSHGTVLFVTIAWRDTPAVLKLMPLSTRNNGTINAITHDSSFVDPYLAGLGSGLVARRASVGFAHLYVTFLARVTLRGVPDVPVVAMVTEALHAALDDRIANCMSLKHGGGVDWCRLIGFILQVMVVLSQGQKAFGLVHNDAHLGNFMVSDADAGTDTNAKPRACLTVVVRDGSNKARLTLPLRERVVLIDFGRASFQQQKSSRLETSEVRVKFPKWERNSMRADVLHFAAMLLLAQPKPGFLEHEAAKTPSPSPARALVRLITAALQCRNVDMHAEYTACHAEGTHECAAASIHRLRGKETHCVGARPVDWLRDKELTRDFFSPSV